MNEPKERTPRVSLRPQEPIEDLRSLARRELARAEHPPHAVITRATLEVRIGDRTELVTLSSDGGRLLLVATDDPQASTVSPAGRSALSFLAALDRPASPGNASERASLRPSPARRPGKVAERLADLAVAIGRSGVETSDPASVREALPRLVAELPSPLPLGVARWLARLVTALAESDARQVARLLAGSVGRTELGWPFVAKESQVSDRRFVELARECVDGFGAQPIERRVLLDEERSAFVIEERYASSLDLDSSVGPCPRILNVGLGILTEGAPPQLRAQQYTVSSEISHELWDRVESLATTGAAAEAAALATLGAEPAAAEPIGLIACPSLEEGEFVDGEGARIPISKEDPGAVEALAEWAHRERLRWVLVRWATRENGLSAVPLAAAHLDGAAWRHVRFR